MADLNVVLQRSCYLSADTDTPVGHGLTRSSTGGVLSGSWASRSPQPAVGGTNKEPEQGTVVFIPAAAAPHQLRIVLWIQTEIHSSLKGNRQLLVN